MTHLKFLKTLFVTVFLCLYCASTNAQTGVLKGIISDESGLYLPGAIITIDATNKRTTTDFNGQFTIVNVPTGTQEITITFIGYAVNKQKVTINANATTSINVAMIPKTNLLDEVTIATRIGGETKALNKQRSNTNITNVISTDQIGKFPDANIGDAIKRVPGITMQVDQGEARNVIIRGLSPQLNSVTLNGSRIPSAEGDNRNIQMDLIPSDMIQTIEVNKAVTPDMDGDA
ncbi:carboxypeptidase-like regulatory domain-containing protein [Tenacibaculum sp. SG-28]|uniref:carboxypeptidase-like regulatory domain-containing protein n=1 Tax=Tenacibaculum sp. SG-28 TaxID=754426 RepID=UPI00267ACA44